MAPYSPCTKPWGGIPGYAAAECRDPPMLVVNGTPPGIGGATYGELWELVPGVAAEELPPEVEGWDDCPGLTRRLRMARSDICKRWVTGGIRERVAGNRLTSCFMSLNSSSNWFRTETKPHNTLLGLQTSACTIYHLTCPTVIRPKEKAWTHYLCGEQHWLACYLPRTPWTDAGGSRPGTPAQQTYDT